MQNDLTPSYTSFDGFRLLSSGSLLRNTLAVKRALANRSAGGAPLLTFDDQTGRTVDTDTRGTEEEIAARFAVATHGKPAVSEVDQQQNSAADLTSRDEPRGRGRPKLGVVAREVTLLPRHWEWLATQPGGASVALRKLVEEARKTNADRDRVRAAQERAYHFMLAIAGNLPGYEEATRALFSNDRAKFSSLIESWPTDVREHAIWLAFGGEDRRAASAIGEAGAAK